jgi:excisionase family DNA binding protein
MSTQNGHGGAPHGRGGTVDPVDFLAVFNDPSLCATLPRDAVAPLLMQVVAGMMRLTALQEALAARILATPPARPAASPEAVCWLTARQVAARTGMSTDWLYRHAGRLPFATRVGRTLRFSADGLRRWMEAGRH